MTADDRELHDLAARLGAVLLAAGLRVTTAESCTGGWIAKLLTDVPGSSQWFTHGFVTYSDAAKTQMLGVPAETLAAHGAVSEPVVAAMAAGAARAADSPCAVAVSGIAGPDGGTPEKPLGTVWICRLIPGRVQTRMQVFAGDREAVRRCSAAAALEGLLADLQGAR